MQAFNLNDLSLGGKFNAKNIMMIKKFDLEEQCEEPLDFDRDFEINVDYNNDDELGNGGGYSDSKSQ